MLTALLLLALPRMAGLGRSSSAQVDLPDLDAACAGDNPYYVTSCFPNRPGPRGGSESVILFRDTPGDMPHYLLADQAAVGPIWGLAFSASEPAVYAEAFHKRLVPFGPGGPSAIYRTLDAEALGEIFASLVFEIPCPGSGFWGRR